MARKTIYKKRPKTRWSVSIQPISIERSYTQGQTIFMDQVLCYNPPKSQTTPIEQLYTIKNIEFSFRTSFSDTSSAKYDGIRNLTAYIMYVPTTGSVSFNLPTEHPEWVLAYKFLGTPMVTMNENAPIKIRSRLARKLHSGDSIYFILSGSVTEASSSVTLQTNGIVKYNTKAN